MKRIRLQILAYIYPKKYGWAKRAKFFSGKNDWVQPLGMQWKFNTEVTGILDEPITYTRALTQKEIDFLCENSK